MSEGGGGNFCRKNKRKAWGNLLSFFHRCCCNINTHIFLPDLRKFIHACPPMLMSPYLPPTPTPPSIFKVFSSLFPPLIKGSTHTWGGGIKGVNDNKSMSSQHKSSINWLCLSGKCTHTHMCGGKTMQNFHFDINISINVCCVCCCFGKHKCGLWPGSRQHSTPAPRSIEKENEGKWRRVFPVFFLFFFLHTHTVESKERENCCDLQREGLRGKLGKNCAWIQHTHTHTQIYVFVAA